MNKLGIIIELPQDIRELYVKYDFKFFIDKLIKESENSNDLTNTYSHKRKELEKQMRNNKKQTLFHIDGAIRKMHSGGFLPSLFELDETRQLGSVDFAECGKDWAYFDIWKKYEKRKIFKNKVSKSILYWGAILAYILTVIKIFEYIKS